MQKKIQTYESNHDMPALDPDLPPELAAAVGQGRQQVSVMPLSKVLATQSVCFSSMQEFSVQGVYWHSFFSSI